MNEFDWETVEYSCLGELQNYGGIVVCFSSYRVGHNIDDVDDCSNSWDMERFKPYTPPKPKTKLWYWEVLNGSEWEFYVYRATEEYISSIFSEYRKLERLDFIEE